MSEVQQQGADRPITKLISTPKDIDVSIPFPRKYLKQPFRYCEKMIVVIHEEIVKQLEINDETWFEQEVTDNGILLRITCFTNKIGKERN